MILFKKSPTLEWGFSWLINVMASIKIKDFFNGRFFEIPKYQRGYAWEVSNIRDLFDDIKESIESSSNHYIGTIVLSKAEDDDEKFYIVDINSWDINKNNKVIPKRFGSLWKTNRNTYWLSLIIILH